MNLILMAVAVAHTCQAPLRCSGRAALFLLTAGLLRAARANPRHAFDARCLPAVELDPVGQARDPSSTSSYLWTALHVGATVDDCASLCCGDWSCEAFAFWPQSNANATCTADRPCCVFKDDIDALVPAPAGVRSGKRGKLAATSPPYPQSHMLAATVSNELLLGINGDEFPITWGGDGAQYTGAGDNRQVGEESSPLGFFRVEGAPSELRNCTHPATHGDQPSPTCPSIALRGAAIPIRGSAAQEACPKWHDDIPNLKSSAVLSVDGVLFWVVSCFNYGDDAVFNRQRYGPAWIVTSVDGGVTWNETATPTDMFTGRLSAPRFVQAGRDYADAPSEWVYLYFPSTNGGAAFFENNDVMLLGRVHRSSILDRAAYEFYVRTQPDGAVLWSTDDSIAQPVWEFPLMTSVQQANYLPGGQGRVVFANWAWISYDGAPRPDHTPDERNDRTGHQRTQLTLVEAPNPWGPFTVMYSDDDWRGSDGSSGAYTPVFAPAWSSSSELWMISTQCCGNPRPPLNHYSFNVQRVTLRNISAPAALYVP